jgi:cytochrome c oxidase assembly factor CtaG
MTSVFMRTAWDWDPTIIAGILILALGYAGLARLHFTRRSLLYYAAILVLLLALVSPLDALSDDYLFSAHMLQHLILILIVAPLFLLGIPPQWWSRLLEWKLADRVEKILSQPVLSWILGMGTLWIWHLPVLYNLALAHENIHTLEHLSFLGTAVIFWWPVTVQPIERRRLGYSGMLIYLFAGALANTVLGIILTFAPVGLYPEYLHPEDTYHILSIIRGSWELDPQSDQQLGGLLMWVPGGLFFLGAILSVLARWFNEPEDDAFINNYQDYAQPMRLDHLENTGK